MIAPSEGAGAVLRFWFDEVGEDRWFARDASLDRAIAERFAALRQQVIESRAEGWRDDPATMTAAIILLDQFSRNMFRDTARAFEGDPLALELALEALDRGFDDGAGTAWTTFLLMPLMHSEDLSVQDRSVEEFGRLGQPMHVDYAIRHRDQIARFGRFPGRNRALGRVSSADEQAAIDRGETF